MNLARAVVTSVWCSAILLAASSQAANIVVDGRAEAVITLPAKASPTEQFAAKELQEYLGQISGAELPIQSEGEITGKVRLLVGATAGAQDARESLQAGDPDSFVVRVLGRDLVLVGATDRATLYAVYDFLEDDLGCRWLGPGADWEVVPRQATIDLPAIDRTERPAMKYRYLRMTVDGPPGSLDAQTLSWAVKQKINIGTGWPPDRLPTSFAELGGFRAWMRPHDMIPNLLPAAKYFDEHPEWYAMIGGQRRRTGRQQLCTTNPEVVKRIAEGIGRVFDARPEMDFLGMGQEDGTAFCECEKCRALDTGEIWPSRDNLPVITERWLSFVNAVARRLQQTHPGKKVYTLAYHQTFRPPDPRTIRPEPNVMIQVVNSRPNFVCFTHRFTDENCPRHVKFRKGLEDWIAMTPAGVMVYEYDPHSTFCSMPYPAAYKFADDIQYLHRVGAIGYEGQSVNSLWGTYGINHYVIAKFTWNPSLGADEVVRDYCNHAFGAASKPMQEFMNSIDRGLKAADHITDGIWSYMTPEVMSEARRHLDAAWAAASDPAARRRLRAYEVGFHYGELGSRAWQMAQKALAAKDAQLLREAIAIGEAAARYCQEEQAKEPHHAAAPGKLTTSWIPAWKHRLAELK